MLSLIVSFIASFISTLLIIRFKHLHQRFSADFDLDGPQKFHKIAVPRIGGISIAIGLFTATIIHTFKVGLEGTEFIFMICAIPTFVIGLLEDLTKKVSVRKRLFFTAISAICAIYFLQIEVTRFDIPFVDFLFTIPLVGVIFTVVAITGLANAYNIIDGFNGLSSMVGIMTLLALAYIAYLFGDVTMIYLSLILAAAILGFFIWNYPQGLIFLGDGGAYLIGFWIGTLSIMICYRHPEISPWFALTINGYPIMETLFTIYRRKIHQRTNISAPDGVHFHTLIYRRVLQAKYSESTLSANARTAPFLWILAILCIIPAMLWWQSTLMLMGACTLFIISYVWLYTKIVQFKTPSWMNF